MKNTNLCCATVMLRNINWYVPDYFIKIKDYKVFVKNRKGILKEKI